MKKYQVVLLISIIFISFTAQGVSATSVFLTSDHVGSQDNDIIMMNSIKNYVEDLSNGSIQVTVDSQAPSPGEGTRAIESDSDVSVTMAASCSGNFIVLAQAAQNTDKQIIFVNTGDVNLDNVSFVRRAWDDNYSSTTFAGINSPGKFLNDAGISYIQPLQEYPDAGSEGSYTSSNDDVNRYIAQQIVNDIENNASSSKTYDSNLIVNHTLRPSVMAEASQSLLDDNDTSMNGTYNSYTAPQVLYMTSSYLNGNGLEQPKDYEQPSSPMNHSSFTQKSYSIYEYMEMASIVKNYMDENGRAPDSIDYKGAHIGYYDLVYNFAKLTANHTDGRHMDFSHDTEFTKLNNDPLAEYGQYIIIIGAIIIVLGTIRRLFRRRRRRY